MQGIMTILLKQQIKLNSSKLLISLWRNNWMLCCIHSRKLNSIRTFAVTSQCKTSDCVQCIYSRSVTHRIDIIIYRRYIIGITCPWLWNVLFACSSYSVLFQFFFSPSAFSRFLASLNYPQPWKIPICIIRLQSMINDNLRSGRRYWWVK